MNSPREMAARSTVMMELRWQYGALLRRAGRGVAAFGAPFERPIPPPVDRAQALVRAVFRIRAPLAHVIALSKARKRGRLRTSGMWTFRTRTPRMRAHRIRTHRTRRPRPQRRLRVAFALRSARGCSRGCTASRRCIAPPGRAACGSVACRFPCPARPRDLAHIASRVRTHPFAILPSGFSGAALYAVIAKRLLCWRYCSSPATT